MAGLLYVHVAVGIYSWSWLFSLFLVFTQELHPRVSYLVTHIINVLTNQYFYFTVKIYAYVPTQTLQCVLCAIGANFGI